MLPFSGMWYTPESLAALVSLIFLAPSEAAVARDARPVSHAAQVAACDAPALTLPDTIQLEGGLEPVVRWALAHSPTFRQQCRVLAAAPRLRATVRISIKPVGVTTRALTSVRQNAWGALAADVEIRSPTELTELLGHEFEHLIEQLDGIDLVALSKEGEARRLGDGAFETDRAVAAGIRVAGEVMNNAPDRMRKAGASVWRALRRAVRAGASAQ